MMQQGITIAGSMLVDYVKIIDIYAQKGMLCNIKKVSKSVGGCVPNTICDIAALDDKIPLKAIGIVGTDADGRFIKTVLADRGIDISDIAETEEDCTSFTDVMTEEKTGERTFFQAQGTNRLLSADKIPYDHIPDGIFHIGYALLLDQLDAQDEAYGTGMAKVLKAVQDRGIATSMDVVSEEGERFARVITPALKYLNYFIINEIEAGKIVGVDVRQAAGQIEPGLIKTVCEKMLDRGVREWVVIHAPEGAWAMNAKREFFACSSVLLPDDYIQGSVGAGDAFCAGMLLSLYKKLPMSEALKVANGAAACNLAAVDSISGMKPLAEVERLYKTLGFR